MSKLDLTLAINRYDHVRDLVEGHVPVQGVDLTCLEFPVEEIFFRFNKYREWEVSELSLAKYCSLRAAGDDSLVAIPVFPSRVFRQSAIFVRASDTVRGPADLAGRCVGVPEWTQTATVYARGALTHQYGVDLTSVQWIQAGTNEPGRTEGVAVELPTGISCTPAPDRSLNDMLLAGDVDAVIAAHPPTEFKRRTGSVVRLVDDFQAAEETYWSQTGVFPIMHVIALERGVYERHPWVAMNLYKAFAEAKRRSLERLTDPNAPFFPLPWGFYYAEHARTVFGEDFWPYGIESNRSTLEAFLQFAHEQGVTSRLLDVEELFAQETQTAFRI